MTRPRFTNGFSIAIQIRWKFRFTLISILIQWSLQHFVHGTTAVLSWHVQKSVAICWPVTELQHGEVSIEFELRARLSSNTFINVGSKFTKKPFKSNHVFLKKDCKESAGVNYNYHVQVFIFCLLRLRICNHKSSDIIPIFTLNEIYFKINEENFQIKSCIS